MRIEVLVGSEDPTIFPLKTSKMLLGSGENCDIILSASGISRKHLTITTEDDRYYVTDMGSTNGSFINEERLVPGRKVEFTSFFPVRLGDNVLVSLLSDEEDLQSDFSSFKEPTSPSIKTPPKERDDSTTVINLKDLNKVRTENLVLERNKKREIRKKASPQKKSTPVKPKKKPNVIGWLAVLIIAGAAYYNIFILKTETDDQEVIKQVGQVVGGPVKKSAPVVKINTNLVSKDDLVEKSDFERRKSNMKCTIDVEIYLCNTLPGANTEGFGVTQIGLTYYAFVDGNYNYEEAKKYLKGDSSEKLLNSTAAYLYFTRGVPLLDEKILGPDSKILIGFYINGDHGPYLKSIVAFKPSTVNQQKDKFNEKQLNFVRSAGLAALSFSEDIYTIY